MPKYFLATNYQLLTTQSQRGFAPILLLIVGVGLLAFLAITALAPFQNNLLSRLNPKKPSLAAGTSDWPMYQGNPQRTGATTATFTPLMQAVGCKRLHIIEVEPCIQPKWKKSSQEWSHGQAQPVVYGNMVFWTVMDGRIHAYDTETGNEKWTFEAGSPIAITPVVVEGKIFFGDFSGKMYGLNITDKSPVFSPIQTEGPIYSSPVAFRENNTLKVFLGSNDGKMYGINGETGQQLFSPFDTGSYIVSSPAFYNGKIFFASENMYAYAISSSTGQEIWKHKLSGETNRFNNPVVITASNTVLFHSVPRFVGRGMGLKDRFGTYTLWGTTPLSTVLINSQTSILATPETKSMHLFQLDSGNEVTSFSADGQTLEMIPLNSWYMNTQNMPLVEDNQNLIFLAFGGIIRLNTLTNQFSVITRYMPVRGDEYTAMTLADGWLYGGFLSNIVKQQIKGQTDINTPNPTVRVQLHGCKDCGNDSTLKYYFLDQPLVSLNHWRSYTGDGATNVGGYFIVANNRAYWSIGGWFYGF